MKKLCKVLLILSFLSITGCSTGNQDASKESNEDVVGTKESKLSKDETMTLSLGQFIEAVDEKTPVIPDEETLESMGLDYEYVIETYTSINDAEYTRDGITQYWYHENPLVLSNTNYESDGKRFETKYKISGIKIIPVIAVHEQDGIYVKDVKLTDESIHFLELANQKNFEQVIQNIKSMD